MAIKNIQIRPKGDGSYSDVLHPETNAGQVKFADGTTVEEHKAEIASNEESGHIVIGHGLKNIDGKTSVVLPLLHIQDEKPQGTNGGTFTSGEWRTRDLNTIKTNEITGASLTSNQITLPAGKYWIEWSCPARDVVTHQTRLYNITDDIVIMLGTSEFMSGSTSVLTRSFGSGIFTLNAQKTLEIQHICSRSQSGNGFGQAGDMATEVYSIVKIWKVGDV